MKGCVFYENCACVQSQRMTHVLINVMPENNLKSKANMIFTGKQTKKEFYLPDCCRAAPQILT